MRNVGEIRTEDFSKVLLKSGVAITAASVAALCYIFLRWGETAITPGTQASIWATTALYVLMGGILSRVAGIVISSPVPEHEHTT